MCTRYRFPNTALVNSPKTKPYKAKHFGHWGQNSGSALGAAALAQEETAAHQREQEMQTLLAEVQALLAEAQDRRSRRCSCKQTI